MDIAALSTAMAMSRLQTSVGTAMLSKTIDTVTDMTGSLVSMMDNSLELSVNPDVGSHIDIKL